MIRVLGMLMVSGLLSAGAALAQSKKPRLPPGLDPGGVAIAVFSTGIDYTAADIATRLARDGEGELIGWDMVGGDNRPYNANAAETPAAWGGDGNGLLRAFGRTGRRIVAVRIDTNDANSLAKAVAFVTHTPARLVVVPMWTSNAQAWTALGRNMAAAGDVLFVVAAGDEGRDIDREPVWPAAFGLANVLVVGGAAGGAGGARASPANFGAKTVDVVLGSSGEAGDTRIAAVLAADALAGCWPHLLQQHRGAALKRALLAEAAKAGAAKPVVERCGQ